MDATHSPTRSGDHTVRLPCPDPQVARVPGPVGALVWNPATAEVYAASGATITVLQQCL